MSNAVAVRDAAAVTPSQFNDALIKAVGWDRVPAEQRALALHICERYDLDPMLRHVVMIEGKPYITRDGLLHVAHRSGVFDGIEVTDPVLVDTHWTCRATVYRKDMTRPFAYPGRYPKAGKNATFAQEMGIKVAEVMALRRAFDVSAPVLEERWDLDEPVTAPAPRPVATLADKAAARRAAIEARTDASVAPATEPSDAPISGGTSSEVHAPEPVRTTTDASGAPEPVAQQASTGVVESPVTGADATPTPANQCEAMSPYDPPSRCGKEAGHKGNHANRDRETWT